MGEICPQDWKFNVHSKAKCTLPGLQIFFKIDGPKWPMEQQMIGHFLKWWIQAYQTNHSWHLGCILSIPTHWHRHLYAYMYIDCLLYSKTVLISHSKNEDQLSLNAGQKYCRMLQGEHSAILWTFIKLPCVIKIFVLSFLSGCLRHVLLYWLPTRPPSGTFKTFRNL